MILKMGGLRTFGWVVRLLYEVNEPLGSHETLKERLILSHILDIVVKVEDIVGTVSSQSAC